MRIFRWVVLIVDVLALGLMVVGFVLMLMEAVPDSETIVAGVTVIALLLANIFFIAMTWRNERRGIGKITGVFE